MTLRRTAGLAASAVVLAQLARAQTAHPTPTNAKPRLSTGITGVITASGRESPEYLLAFGPVQIAVLEAARGRLDRAGLEAALAGTPVTAADLTRAGLLREEKGAYRLDYLVLTVDDQNRIYRVTQPFGASLAKSFLARRAEFDRAVEDVRPPDRRRELLFGLVTGMLLNWEGLKISTDLGYRVAPKRFPNGDAYLVHSSEIGARLETKGMYWGSHSFPGMPMTFSTFGDADSLPRMRGIPDVF